MGATPGGKKQRSRWDETPAGVALAPGATPMVGVGATPFGMTPGMTPMGGADMATPSPSALGKVPMTAEQYQVCMPAALRPLQQPQPSVSAHLKSKDGRVLG